MEFFNLVRRLVVRSRLTSRAFVGDLEQGGSLQYQPYLSSIRRRTAFFAPFWAKKRHFVIPCFNSIYFCKECHIRHGPSKFLSENVQTMQQILRSKSCKLMVTVWPEEYDRLLASPCFLDIYVLTTSCFGGPSLGRSAPNKRLSNDLSGFNISERTRSRPKHSQTAVSSYTGMNPSITTDSRLPMLHWDESHSVDEIKVRSNMAKQ